MGVVFRRSASIVPDSPAEPRQAVAFGIRTFHTPEGRAAAYKIAQGPRGDLRGLQVCFPYLPPGLLEPAPDFRPPEVSGSQRTFCISLLTFVIVGSAAAWLIGG